MVFMHDESDDHKLKNGGCKPNIDTRKHRLRSNIGRFGSKK